MSVSPAITICNVSDKIETTEGITLTKLAKDNKSTLPLDVKLSCLIVSILHTLTLECSQEFMSQVQPIMTNVLICWLAFLCASYFSEHYI